MVVTEILYNDIKCRNRPSFFAAPLAWAAADFVHLLLQADTPVVMQATGVIVASDECSLGTVRELACAAKTGSVSPLRFAGASPSIVAGLPAFQHGLRGPTMALTMRPEHAADAMVAITQHWIGVGNALSVVIIGHQRQDDGRHLFRGLIAHASEGDFAQPIRQLCRPEVAGSWAPCPVVAALC